MNPSSEDFHEMLFFLYIDLGQFYRESAQKKDRA